MPENSNDKKYNLEERTLNFAKSIRDYIKIITKNISNNEYSRQIIRSSASIGANYIEANESLSRKDFAMRVKICRKEAKETIYWLNLIETKNKPIELIQEGTELMKIFGAIIEKTKN